MLTRHRDPRVTPLEVWDLLVAGTPLYSVPRDRHFAATLGRAVESLIDGTAVSESLPTFPAACRHITRVVLVGGAASEVRWTHRRIPAISAPDPEHCAERGGLAILAAAGKRGLVVDLGQSRLKIRGTSRHVHTRDLTDIPISTRPVMNLGRAALISWAAAALRQAAKETTPEAIVLALPCEVDPHGAPGTCSYPWSAGDPIVHDMLAAADLTHLPTCLLNDAELAALGVATDATATTGDTTLVLTLGFGVGGALLRPTP